MKSQTVEAISSNEELVRQRIFDGDLQVSEASQALLAAERKQNASLRARIQDLRDSFLKRDARLRAERDAAIEGLEQLRAELKGAASNYRILEVQIQSAFDYAEIFGAAARGDADALRRVQKLMEEERDNV